MSSDCQRRLPAFFIVGAQKSGTASLSALLASRDDVFISSPREPMFFCRDDVALHPHTLLSNPKEWRNFDWRARQDELVEGYARLFASARSDQLAGEGSTTYLTGREVPARIAEIQPSAKIIALFRNPIDRAYSAYFHHLKNFRVLYSFEEQLKFEPGDILEIGNYKRHLERYLSVFPSRQVLVLAFEEFAERTQSVYDRVCDFLELPLAQVREDAQKVNEALVPRFIGAQRLVNGALRFTRASFEAGPLRSLTHEDGRPLALRFAEKALHGIGRANRDRRRYPAMRPETRELLRDYYQRQNLGLSELSGQDFSAWWRDFERV